MRSVAIFGIALLVGMGPARAQSPVVTHPLAANETLLEVAAQGTARGTADQAQLILQVAGRGETEAEANAALGRELARVRQVAVAAGVAPDDIGAPRPASFASLIGAAASPSASGPADIDVEEMGADSEERLVSTQTRGIQITVRNLSALARLRTSIEALNLGTPSVSYELSGTAPAHQQARAAGLAQARTRAQGYAEAMGMRIARVIRVSERISASGMGIEAYTSLMQMFMAAGGGSDDQVEARVELSVDYALAPR